MRVLALDAALARCSAAIVTDGVVMAMRLLDGARGHAASLPPMAAEVLAEAGGAPDLVAVTIGPGSFTGLRAALSLAHGIALGAGCRVVGVTLGEVFGLALPHLGGRTLWTAIDSRRDRIFLEREGSVMAVATDALPLPQGRVAVAGDAAMLVAATLAARGRDVMLTDARLPQPRQIALAAMLRASGAWPDRAALPLYVDPPEAREPAGGLRPAPAG